MTNEHARLQRRPFLAPIWLFSLTAMTALAGAVVLMFAAWLWITADSTVIIVIRHAEKVQDGSVDPALEPAGEARAALLARMFGDARLPGHIDAIYVSPALRSRLTAAPLAARLGINPTVAAADDPKRLARRIMHDHSGGRILVVGHTDTMPALVAALSGARDIPPIDASEYGTLYVITVPRIGRPNFLRLNY
jgi:broad specificity phosphatase PhoE